MLKRLGVALFFTSRLKVWRDRPNNNNNNNSNNIVSKQCWSHNQTKKLWTVCLKKAEEFFC